MTKQECMNRLEIIKEQSGVCAGCELVIVAKDWANGGKNRTYFAIIERSTDSKASKHYKKKEYGYLDNVTGEYVPAKYGDLTRDHTFGGNTF